MKNLSDELTADEVRSLLKFAKTRAARRMRIRTGDHSVRRAGPGPTTTRLDSVPPCLN